MALTTYTAIQHVLARLNSSVGLTGVTFREDMEAGDSQEGIMFFVSSPGIVDGNTDGHENTIEPLVTVVAFASTRQRADTLDRLAHTAIESTSGSYEKDGDSAFVERCSRERPYHDTGRTPSQAVRHYQGGLYRFLILEDPS